MSDTDVSMKRKTHCLPTAGQAETRCAKCTQLGRPCFVVTVDKMSSLRTISREQVRLDLSKCNYRAFGSIGYGKGNLTDWHQAFVLELHTITLFLLRQDLSGYPSPSFAVKRFKQNTSSPVSGKASSR